MYAMNLYKKSDNTRKDGIRDSKRRQPKPPIRPEEITQLKTHRKEKKNLPPNGLSYRKC
jgi:hypothetical protein